MSSPRRMPLPQRCPYFGPGDLLAEARGAAADLKRGARARLRSIGVEPRLFGWPIGGGQGDRLLRRGRSIEESRLSGPARRATTPPDRAPTVQHPQCVAIFDANSKVTTIRASADIETSVEELASIVDPRAWGLGGGVIEVAFRVSCDAGGQYAADEEDVHVELGTEWKAGKRREPALLFEYARSEIASFENILAIDRFEWNGDSLIVEYRLYDCLKTNIGFASVDGGLQKNDGWVRVAPNDAGGSTITVEKNIRVRDMTPNDPGNRYDFGEWMNSTMGAALSMWVDDTSMMSPVF